MKPFFFITCLFSLNVSAQDFTKHDHQKIYQKIIENYIEADAFIINEIFIPITRYDIDGNVEKWFYQSFPPGRIICAVPIQYEKTVIQVLIENNLHTDTSGIFLQIKEMRTDSLVKYNPPGRLISYSRAPIGNSFIRNLFMKKKAIAFSPILFDEVNQIALIKYIVFSKVKNTETDDSKMIILQKRNKVWTELEIIRQKINHK